LGAKCDRQAAPVHSYTRLVKLKFHGTVFLVASSRHPREAVRNKSCVSGVSGDFPVQLATRLPDWSAGGLLRCSAARLSVCRCRFPKSPSTARTTCCGHPREDVTRMLRRKLVPWNSSFTDLLTFRRGMDGRTCNETGRSCQKSAGARSSAIAVCTQVIRYR